MKKIIIAAAAIVMGASVFAASAPWKATTTGVYTRNSTDKYSGTIYYFDAGTYAMATVFGNMLDKVWTASTIGNYAAGSAAVANGASANKAFSYGDGGSKYDIYGVIVDGNYIYFTQQLSDKTASTSTTAATLQFGAQGGSTSFNGKNGVFNGVSAWSSTVEEEKSPEPTSGLLLVLGMAGLALRRRRA